RLPIRIRADDGTAVYLIGQVTDDQKAFRVTEIHGFGHDGTFVNGVKSAKNVALPIENGEVNLNNRDLNKALDYTIGVTRAYNREHNLSPAAPETVSDASAQPQQGMTTTPSSPAAGEPDVHPVEAPTPAASRADALSNAIRVLENGKQLDENGRPLDKPREV